MWGFPSDPFNQMRRGYDNEEYEDPRNPAFFPGGAPMGMPGFDQFFGRPAQQQRTPSRRTSAEHPRQSFERSSFEGQRSQETKKHEEIPKQQVPKQEPVKETPSPPPPPKKSYAEMLRDTLSPEEYVEKRANSARVLQKNLNQLAQNRATKDILAKLHKVALLEKELNQELERHESSVMKIPLTFEDNGRRVIPNRYNRPFLQYEDVLQKLLLKLDEISTGGHDIVREKRKALVSKVQAALDRVDKRREEEKVARRLEQEQGLPGPEIPSRSPSRSPPLGRQPSPPIHHGETLQVPGKKVETIPIQVEKPQETIHHVPKESQRDESVQTSQPEITPHDLDQHKKKKKNRRKKNRSQPPHDNHESEEESESTEEVNVPPRRPAQAAHEAASHVAQQAKPQVKAPVSQPRPPPPVHQPAHQQGYQQQGYQQGYPPGYGHQARPQHPSHPTHPSHPAQQRRSEEAPRREQTKTVQHHPVYGPYIIDDDDNPVLVELRQLPDGRTMAVPRAQQPQRGRRGPGDEECILM